MTYIAYVSHLRHKEVPVPQGRAPKGFWKSLVVNLRPSSHVLIVMDQGDDFNRIRSGVYQWGRKLHTPLSVVRIENHLEVRRCP
jgi:hypothetical protein